MTFELWLYAVKKLAQTYDAAGVIFHQLPKERQEELKREYAGYGTSDHTKEE